MYGTPSPRVDGAEHIRKSYGKNIDRRPSLDGDGKSNASAKLCNGVLANPPVKSEIWSSSTSHLCNQNYQSLKYDAPNPNT